MITTIRNWLLANKVEIGINAWYESGIANLNAQTPKPFGFVELGPLFPSGGNRATGVQVIRLGVAFTRSNWDPVRKATETIRRRLHDQLLTLPSGDRFRMIYSDTSGGDFDPALGAFVQVVTFQVFMAL